MEKAEEKEEAKVKVALRFTGKLEGLAVAARATTVLKQAKQAKQAQHWLGLHREAEGSWNEARLARKDAEIAWLEAQLREREVEAALSGLLYDVALASV